MDRPRDIVILLHGIGRTGRSMQPLAQPIEQAGYETMVITYPWRSQPIEGLAHWVAARLAEDNVWERTTRLHFVTHSMGGLVARRLLQDLGDMSRIGRMVMLGPPNAGSEVADALHRLPPYRWLYGPAGQQLTTTASRLGEVLGYELGVIAGSRGWPYLLGNLTIRGPHDGRVAVARTHLTGMADHIVLPVTHSFMPANRQVHRQVVHFLAEGRFAR